MHYMVMLPEGDLLTLANQMARVISTSTKLTHLDLYEYTYNPADEATNVLLSALANSKNLDQITFFNCGNNKWFSSE